MDIYNRLYRERIIFLGQEIDDEICNQIIAVMLFSDPEEPNKPLYLYINSPGGSVTAGLALYDTMGHVSSDVITVNAGAAGRKSCLGGGAAHYPGVLGRPFQARGCAAGLGRATEPFRSQWEAAVRP